MKNKACITASSFLSFFSRIAGRLMSAAMGKTSHEAVHYKAAGDPPPGQFMKWLAAERPELVRTTSPNLARVYNYTDYQTGPPGLRVFAES